MGRSVKQIVIDRLGNRFEKYPDWLRSWIYKSIDKLLHLREIDYWMDKDRVNSGLDLIDEIFDEFNFTFYVSQEDLQKIPYEGRLVCVSNHPLGGLDGLSVVRLIANVRSDVKVIVNDLLLNLKRLSDLFLPFNVYSRNKTQKANIKEIENNLMKDQAIVFFSSAEVSRPKWGGIRDGKWHKGAVRFATKYNAPILPIYVQGRNSLSFYLISLINKNLSMLLLPRELFKKQNSSIKIKIGDPIPPEVLENSGMNYMELTEKLKKHVYNIGKGRKELFKTDKTIIHPVDKKSILNDLKNSELMYDNEAGKKVYAVDYKNGKSIVREISRIRELTYRKVGEGTGRKNDFDEFDRFYKHFIVWDETELEIAGAYRMGVCSEIMKERGIEGIYNSGQFDFTDKFLDLLPECLEVGRSVIQQPYWKLNILDLLWKAFFGNYVVDNYSHTKYLFGAVSISDSYPQIAKDMIVYYYNKWFANGTDYVKAKKPYVIPDKRIAELHSIFDADDYNAEFITLKKKLAEMGLNVPVLLRQYLSLVEYGGGSFLGFGIDTSFSNSVDALLMLDMTRFRKYKYERYYLNKKTQEENSFQDAVY